MANTKISALPSGTPALTTDLFPIDRAGTNYSLTAQSIAVLGWVSPALTGTPTAPTASPLTNTTQIGTTAYTDLAVGVETARAQAAEALLAPLVSPALTGSPTAPTQPVGTTNTTLATTGFTSSLVGTLYGVPRIILNGLVGRFAMTDGSGSTMADSSGNGYNATLGSGGFAPTWIASGGLTFNGGQYVDFPSTLNGVITIQIVTDWDTSPLVQNVGGQSGYSSIILDPNGKNGTALYGQTLTNGKDSALSGWGTNGGPAFITGLRGLYDLAFVLGSSSANPNEVYINGFQKTWQDQYAGGSNTSHSQGTIVNNWRLGGSTANNGFALPVFIKGHVYYVLMYNRQLSQQELQQNSQALSAIMSGRGLSYDSVLSTSVSPTPNPTN